ncbi:MAG: ATP-binding cassette domain-containing protein, partial [bacterium]
MSKVIQIDKLSKTYKTKIKQSFWKDFFRAKRKDVRAVNNLSFRVDEGESVAFLGPNGAGKTTTIKMLTGLIYPTDGS